MAAKVKGDPPQGDRQSLTMVRPEDVVFGAAVAEQENIYEAELVDWTYMGEKTEYVFEVEGIDYTLQAIQEGTPAMADADIGSTVPVGWDREDTLCFGTVSSTPADTVTSVMEV
jgi:ABC-type Fe3+/spermidine/putrescine transport system ATPase subunit